MAWHVNRELDLESVHRTLAEGLGHGYQVSAASASTLKVRRSGLLHATVSLHHTGGGTTIRIRPGGVFLVLLLNALWLVPRIRRALAALPVS